MEVQFRATFKKRLRKLPLKLREQFRDRLALFILNKFNPLLCNHLLKGSYLGCRSINVTGDRRAIFKEEGDTVVFVDIGTHAELYGR